MKVLDDFSIYALFGYDGVMLDNLELGDDTQGLTVEHS